MTIDLNETLLFAHIWCTLDFKLLFFLLLSMLFSYRSICSGSICL